MNNYGKEDRKILATVAGLGCGVVLLNILFYAAIIALIVWGVRAVLYG